MAVAQRRRLILSSPHDARLFVVAHNDLRLYETQSVPRAPTFEEPPTERRCEKDNEEEMFRLVALTPEVQLPRCLGWCLEQTDPVLMAAGLPSGHVRLVSLGQQNSVTVDLVPRSRRPCNDVSWNPVFKSRLAAGLDRLHSECCVSVWDVNEQGSATRARGRLEEPHVTVVSTPIVELSKSEAMMAISWIPSQPDCLATGAGYKWLRIHDLRDAGAPRSVVAHGKAVEGVAPDPFSSERLATFSEDGLIKIWDTRRLLDPVCVFNTNSRTLQMIEWCPTRRGTLASISRDEEVIQLWDMRDSLEGRRLGGGDTAAQLPLGKLRKSICPTFQEPLTSFSWNHHLEQRLVAISSKGRVEDVTLHDPIPLSWSPRGPICFAMGKFLHEVHVPKMPDISNEMKSRVLHGYGLDVETNCRIVEELGHDTSNYAQLHVLWNWIRHSLVLEANGTSADVIPFCQFPGVNGVIVPSVLPSYSSRRDDSFDGRSSVLPFPVYRSSKRVRALKICGWGFDDRTKLEEAIVLLESEGEFERAAVLALFHHDLQRAISALMRGSNAESTYSGGDLQLVAMALAGFSNQEASLWNQMCEKLQRQFGHPSLRAAFSFLCSDGENYQATLESGMSLTDRVGFACSFLPDEALSSFLEKTTREVVANGDLEGILLTGLSSEGVDLLERYLDRSGDVQTVGLVMSYAVPRCFPDARVKQWLDSYRDLLNTWQLWHERAHLDMAHALLVDAKAPPQVVARCNYCNSPLSTGMAKQAKPSRRTALNTSMGPHKAKSAACPGCGKQFPRCAVCLLPLGCPSTSRTGSLDHEGGSSHFWSVSSDFGHWAAWCQTCMHGGHAAHLAEWFQTHAECPVNDCACHCMSFQ